MAKYKITRNDLHPNEAAVITPYGCVTGFIGVAYTDNKEAAEYLANNGMHCGALPQFEVEEVQDDTQA